MTPYRVVVFSDSCAWVAWQANTAAEPARAGFGSFLFYGALRAIARARAEFANPTVCQVQIRTNQDRKVLIYNRQANGRLTCYAGEA